MFPYSLMRTPALPGSCVESYGKSSWTSADGGVECREDVIASFKEMKDQKHLWVSYRISKAPSDKLLRTCDEKYQAIRIANRGDFETKWKDFKNELGDKDPCYILYNCTYDTGHESVKTEEGTDPFLLEEEVWRATGTGEGGDPWPRRKHKLVMIIWLPDEASNRDRMLYATLKKSWTNAVQKKIGCTLQSINLYEKDELTKQTIPDEAERKSIGVINQLKHQKLV